VTPFRWANCFADVETCKHDLTIQSYLNDVIAPALATLERKIAELAASEWPGAVFAHADMQVMLRESKIAFGLSIQSIWERQLRTYLRGCIRDLRPGEALDGKVEKANWKDLQKWFRELRGICLDAFPSFEMLDTLQHLGNACRHGDGDSAAELARRCPNLWPVMLAVPPMPHLPPDTPVPAVALRVSSMDIPVKRLSDFVAAISSFWRDHEYIYNESIERKDAGLERRLAKERAERSWIPLADGHHRADSTPL
jgi:hypothetical protein